MQMHVLRVSKDRQCTSTYFGVSWHKTKKAWWAKISVDGQRKILGFFDDEIDAARANNTEAAKHGRPLNVLPDAAERTESGSYL